MKKAIFPLFLLFACHTNAEEIRYISDELRVPLRTSPCNSCKIVHGGLRSGTRLTVLENNGEGWAHVRTSRDVEGWLPEQYLVDQQVAKIRITAVENAFAELKTRHQALQATLDEKDTELAALHEQLTQLSDEKSRVSDQLAEIRQISTNAVSIHEQNQELGKRNQLLKNEVDILTASNKQLKDDQIYNWFIYGALSVFLGAVLTAILPRLKRKRRYSEWS